MRYRAFSTGVNSGLPSPIDTYCRVMITAYYKSALFAFVDTNSERHLLPVTTSTANLTSVSWRRPFKRLILCFARRFDPFCLRESRRCCLCSLSSALLRWRGLSISSPFERVAKLVMPTSTPTVCPVDGIGSGLGVSQTSSAYQPSTRRVIRSCLHCPFASLRDSLTPTKNLYIETKGRISTVPSLSRMGQPFANSTAWSMSLASTST
jgi:hypothetical protein